MKEKNENLSLLTKVIIVLYFTVALTPFFYIYEYEAFQWLFFSVVNVLSLGLIFFNREYLQPTQMSRNIKIFFGIFIGFFLVSVISSILKAIFISESIVHLARLINIIIAIFCLFTLLKKSPKEYFKFICQLSSLIVLFYSVKTFAYFMGNYSTPRTSSFTRGFDGIHKFGNINIFTSFIVIQLPLIIYQFLSVSNKWRYFYGGVAFMGLTSLIFSGSRTALLSSFLIFIVYLMIGVVKLFKEKTKEVKLNTFFFVLIPVLSVFFVLNTNRLYKNKMNSINDIFYTPNDKFKSVNRVLKKNKELTKTGFKLAEGDAIDKVLEKTSSRDKIWGSAISMFKENLWIGTGYGNYKTYDKKGYYQTKKSPSGGYSVTRRVHNDFLEKFVETGVLGGVLYISVFIFLLFLLLKNIKNKEYSIVLTSVLFASMAYFFDAFLNFPLERAPIQAIFVFLVVVILIFANSLIKKEGGKKKKTPILLGLAFLVTLASVYYNYQTFLTYKAIVKIANESKQISLFDTSKKYKVSQEYIDKNLNRFTDLTNAGGTNDLYKVLFAINNQEFDKALKIIDSKNHLPIERYAVLNLKAQIFNHLKQNDSAEYYARYVFDGYPAFKNNYNLLRKIYIENKDTLAHNALIQEYTKRNYVDTDEWIRIANIRNKKGKNLQEALAIIDTAIAYNPKGKDLILAKDKLLKYDNVNSHIKRKDISDMYDQVVALYNKKQYPEAKKILLKLLKIEPTDHFALMYLGVVEMQSKNYDKAIVHLTQAINKKVFVDGKPEYCRGYCYEKLGLKEQAKKDYLKSRAKGYGPAMKLKMEQYQ